MTNLELYEKAELEGREAASAVNVNPMYVTSGATTWKVDDGVCGFAWVTIFGNTSFVKWLKANHIARKNSGRGVTVWVSAYNQSVTRKEAFAKAFAAVLKEAGVDAYADSRMD